jgi:hypothetical protein
MAHIPKVSYDNLAMKTILIVIPLLTVLVYIPALHNDFVNWDDNKYVYENEHIWSLGKESLWWMFTAYHASNWHPLTWLSHGIDYAMWGLNPLGHHLTSIVLHGLNTLLVVVLITRLVSFGRNDITAQIRNTKYEIRNSLLAGAVTGLLFGLHPLHVESVAWVSERKDMLYAFFYLLSILVYVKYVGAEVGKRAVPYVVCLVLFLLSLLSKPMAVTLPVVLLILDVYPLGRTGIKGLVTSQRRVVAEKVPFFVLTIVSSILTLQAQEAGGALIHFKSQLLVGRVLVALRSLMFYLYKMVLPAELVPFYPYPAEVSLFDIQYLGSMVLVVGITVFSIWMWRRQKIWAAVWVYYVVSLFPVLGIVQVGGQAAADRYTYMPSLGPFLLIGIGVVFLKDLALKRWSPQITEDPDRRASFAPKARATFLMLSFFIVCIFTVLTIQQQRVWKDSFALWNTELRSFPQVFIAYRNLGAAYGVQDNYEAALKNFTKAIELNPFDPLSFYNRGIIYGKSGLHDKAIEDLQEAIRLDPLSGKFHNNLGVAYGISGNFQEAITSFDRAVELDPTFANAYFHRGVTYIRLGLTENAFRDFRAAAQLGDAGAQNYLQTRGMRWKH